MLNNNVINENGLNTNVEGVSDTGEVVSSFNSETTTIFAHIGELGSIYNFNTIAGDCKGNGKQNYGNILTKHNFNDLPEKNITKYDTPFINGGIIQSENYTDFIFDIEFEVTSADSVNLQKEIQAIKKSFTTQGKLFKKEYNRDSYINVILDSFEIEDMKLSGTKINAIFLSVDPFWKAPNKITRFYENQTAPIDGNIYIADSDMKPKLETIIQIGEVTGTIDKLTLEYNGYEIEINKTITSNSIIIFDGNTDKVNYKGNELKYKGQFMPFPLGVSGSFKFNYTGGGDITNYSLYILYNVTNL